MPLLTADGPQSILHVRNIEVVDQFIDRTPNGHQLSIRQIAEIFVLNTMSSVMRTRSDLVFDKVGEFPQGPGDTQVWQNWPIKMILKAWRPCIEMNSSATQALSLKELLTDVKVACEFNKS